MKKGFFLGIALCLLSSLCLPAWALSPVADLSEEISAEASKDLSSSEDIPSENISSSKAIPSPLAGEGIAFKNTGGYSLSAKIETLQEEIAQLRGELEVQAHELKTLKNTQQELAEDLDRRVPQQAKPAAGNSSINPYPPSGLSGHFPPQGGEGFPPLKLHPDYQKQEQAYNKAFDLLKNKKYTQATVGLKNFLKQYGDKKQEGEASKYVLNAYYWLGELYFLQGDFDQAAQQFKAIVKQFPGKPKVPDAMLKLGLISVNLGKKTEARQMFQNIKKRFPNSSAAHLAALELQKL